MVDEIVDVFAPVPPGIVLDATLGGGGHSRGAARPLRADLSVLGIDRDRGALAAAAAAALRPVRRPRSTTVPQPLRPSRRGDPTTHGVDELSGALFDLGVSSPQLDRADRGFSYRNDGPLDMRMDRTAAAGRPPTSSTATTSTSWPGSSAATATSASPRRIARAIVAARPIETTTELAAIVTDGDPGARPGAPAATRPSARSRRSASRSTASSTRSPTALDSAIEATRPGGRIAVLSYHSGEDRIVKERFRVATGACDCPPGLPCVCGARADRAPRARRAASAVGGRRRGATAAPARRACASPRSVGAAVTPCRCAGSTAADAAARRRRSAALRAPRPLRPAVGVRRSRRDGVAGVADADDAARARPELRVVPAPRARRQRRGARRRAGRRADAVGGRAAHPPGRAPARDRPARAQVGDRATSGSTCSASSAPSCARRPAWRSRAAGSACIAAPDVEFLAVDPWTVAQVIAAAGTIDRGARHRSSTSDPLDQVRRVKAASDGAAE